MIEHPDDHAALTRELEEVNARQTEELHKLRAELHELRHARKPVAAVTCPHGSLFVICDDGTTWQANDSRTGWLGRPRTPVPGTRAGLPLRNPQPDQALVRRLERELATARNRVAVLRRLVAEEYWIWQGDGEDHLGSLTCPVVIMPRELEALLATAERRGASEAMEEVRDR